MSVIRHMRINNPAVGADVAETIPAGVVWEIRGFACHYTPDANAGNRYLYVTIFRPGLFPGGIIYFAVMTTALVASTIKFNSMSPTQSTPAVARWEATHSGAIARIPMMAGDIFSVSALNKKAGDFMDAVNLQVEEYKL